VYCGNKVRKIVSHESPIFGETNLVHHSFRLMARSPFWQVKKKKIDAQSTMFQVVVDDDLHNVPIAHI